MKSPLRAGFALRLAKREAKHGFRRIGLYMASIAIGVGALVAIQSFRDDVVRAVYAQAEQMMGANVRIMTPPTQPLGSAIESILDSLTAESVRVGRITTTTMMISGPADDDPVLARVSTVQGGFPFYGEVESDPPGAWTGEIPSGEAFIGSSVAAEVGVGLGDTLVVGSTPLIVTAVVDGVPGADGLGSVLGPPVYVAADALQIAGFGDFGSLALHQAFLALPDENERIRFREDWEHVWSEVEVAVSFAEEEADAIAEVVGFMGRFFSLVGVAALLLGGIGVASAVHIYSMEKRTSIAVLRCVGSGRWTAFLAYVVQAAGLGLGGALLGGLVGTGIQSLLPVFLADFLPFETATRPSLSAWAAGIGVGVWVAVAFSLIPLLQVRRISPLEAFRTDYGTDKRSRRTDPALHTAYLLVGITIVALCMIEAPIYQLGLVFAGGLTVALGLLALSAWGIVSLTRKHFPRRMPYPVRQGAANLFRPRNQTLSLTVALGSGAFVIGVMVVVGGSISRALDLITEGGQPSVIFYNVSAQDKDGVTELLRASEGVATFDEGREVTVEDDGTVVYRQGSHDVLSMSTAEMGVVEINWVPIEDIVADSSSGVRDRVLRTTYGTTVRAELDEGEEVVEGEWWDELAERDTAAMRLGSDDFPVRASITEGTARSLSVDVGDTVVWETAGMFVTTVVTSLRETDGVASPSIGIGTLNVPTTIVLEPGSERAVPITYVLGAVFVDQASNSRAQRAVREAYPGVSAFDTYRIRELFVSIVTRVQQGIVFLSVFSVLVGLVVLVGVLATSRAQRFREGALLRTLGASRRQIVTVLLAEFLTLGTLATFAGLLLGALMAIPLLLLGLNVAHTPQVVQLLGLWVAMMAATAAVGMLSSRGLLTRPPLATLRAE